MNAQEENLEDLAIADSGSTSHMFKSEESIFDVKEASDFDTVKIGNKGQMKILKFGKKWISLVKVMNNGFEVSGEDFFHNLEGKFQDGLQPAVEHKKGICWEQGTRFSALWMEPGTTVPIIIVHECLGHANEDVTRAMAENLGMKLTRKLYFFEDCALAKTHRTPVSKEATNKEKVPGGRLLLHISSIFWQEIYGGTKFWCMIQDVAPKMKCFF